MLAFERVRSCDLYDMALVCLKGTIRCHSDFILQSLSRCAIWLGKEGTGSLKSLHPDKKTNNPLPPKNIEVKNQIF